MTINDEQQAIYNLVNQQNIEQHDHIVYFSDNLKCLCLNLFILN